MRSFGITNFSDINWVVSGMGGTDWWVDDFVWVYSFIPGLTSYKVINILINQGSKTIWRIIIIYKDYITETPYICTGTITCLFNNMYSISDLFLICEYCYHRASHNGAHAFYPGHVSLGITWGRHVITDVVTNQCWKTGQTKLIWMFITFFSLYNILLRCHCNFLFLNKQI